MQAEEREQGRQHQLLGVLPLPRRVSPRPSEDLASVIVRTAHAMGYSEPGWILRPEKVAHVVAPGELALLRRRLDYELLMRLLDIDEATLYRLTLHRFAMCYEFPDWALISPEPPRRKVYSRELPLLHRLADYQVIERALGLGEAELHHMTLHCFAARLQSPERGARAPSSYPAGESIDRPLLSRSTVRRLDISLRSTKICPGCLDEAPAYDRLFWRLRSVILCPYHALLLLDRCLYCSAPIPGLRRSPGRCPYCRREYLQAPRALIAPTSWLYEDQTLLLHQLTAENANGWTGSPAFAGSPVLRIEPWHYFALLERFENFLQPRLAGSIVMQTLKKLAWVDDQSASESPVIQKVALQIALFHYLLASWPENLLAALDRTHTLLKGQHERRGALGDSWQAEADRLAQRIRSASIDDDAPFVLLSQVFDTFFTWATLTGIPTRR